MDKSHHKTKHNHNDIDLLDDLAQIKQLLAATARDAKGKSADLFRQGLDNVKVRSSDLRDNSANYIAERPFATVGVALVSGLILGLLLKKKD